MHGKYFFLAFAVIMVLASLVAGSLTKITAGAPVYIGEQNLDISAGLQGCRVIDWWEDGADMTAPPSKNVTIIKTLEDSDIAFSYSIDPAIYTGYTGTWYCEGKRPLRAIFEVVRPRLSISFWDMDNNVDITGKTVSQHTNITYRVETNLDRALQYKYRPEVTPLDSFFTVTMTDSRGKPLNSLYTGSYGKADTRVIIFENRPFISASPYIWKDGGTWNLESRNAQGEFLYPAGTYALTVKQNLNHMETMYTNISPEGKTDLLETTASFTYTKPESGPSVTVSILETVPSGTVTTPPIDVPVSTPTPATNPVTRTTVPPKTTYATLSLWAVFSGLGIAFACVSWKRK